MHWLGTFQGLEPVLALPEFPTRPATPGTTHSSIAPSEQMKEAMNVGVSTGLPTPRKSPLALLLPALQNSEPRPAKVPRDGVGGGANQGSREGSQTPVQPLPAVPAGRVLWAVGQRP